MMNGLQGAALLAAAHAMTNGAEFTRNIYVIDGFTTFRHELAGAMTEMRSMETWGRRFAMDRIPSLYFIDNADIGLLVRKQTEAWKHVKGQQYLQANAKAQTHYNNRKARAKQSAHRFRQLTRKS